MLKPDARTDPHEAAQRVKKFAGASVLISGHTDNVGSAASHQALSRQRAAVVKDYFVTQEGIAVDTLATKGFGSAQPSRGCGDHAEEGLTPFPDVSVSCQLNHFRRRSRVPNAAYAKVDPNRTVAAPGEHHGQQSKRRHGT